DVPVEVRPALHDDAPTVPSARREGHPGHLVAGRGELPHLLVTLVGDVSVEECRCHGRAPPTDRTCVALHRVKAPAGARPVRPRHAAPSDRGGCASGHRGGAAADAALEGLLSEAFSSASSTVTCPRETRRSRAASMVCIPTAPPA